MIQRRDLPRMPATSSTLATSSSSGKVLELLGFEQSAKRCHEYAQCLGRDDSRRARIEHPSPAGVSHQFLPPRDSVQSRLARSARYTGKAISIASQCVPHKPLLRSVLVRLTNKAALLVPREEPSSDPNDEVAGARASVIESLTEANGEPDLDDGRRIANTQRIVVTDGH